MAKFRTIDQVPDEHWRGKCVLDRVDFNVPIAAGTITNDTRIQAALPTIRHLCERGARVVLISHLGRPKGVDLQYSLAPVALQLGKLLGIAIPLTPPGTLDVKNMLAVLTPGAVAVLENIRFFPEEEKNDDAFSRQLANLGDIYVNDAFGTAHRAHASTTGVAAYLPAYAGFLMQKELQALGELLENPRRPFVAVIGGAKVSSKIGVLERLLQKIDTLIIGGGMAFTFLKARGLGVGKSLVEEAQIDFARSLLRQTRVSVLLPGDVILAASANDDQARGTVAADQIPVDQYGLDIGPESSAQFRDCLRNACTVLWNGPMGVFERPAFAYGTHQMAHTLADATARGCITVVGGGDSVAAIEELGLTERFTHISTGGGATLEFLEGKELPGVAALSQPAGRA